MIGLYRTAAIASGKNASAMAFAAQIASYIKEKTSVEVRVAIPIGGNPNRVAWSVLYENLGAMEKHMGALLGDSKYIEMIAKGSDNFIAGSVHDEIWRAL